MDYETLVENCLTDYSPIRAKDLLAKLHQRSINISRSQFYRYGKKLEIAAKLERKNGIWHYKRKLPHEKTAEEEFERTVRSKIDEARQAWENGDLSIANRKIWTASTLIASRLPELGLVIIDVSHLLQDEENRVLTRFPHVTTALKREIVSLTILYEINTLEAIFDRKEKVQGEKWKQWTGEELRFVEFQQSMDTLLRSFGLKAKRNKEAESHES